MHPLPHSLRWPLVAIALFLALGAIPAGVAFVLSPDGSLVGMPLAVLGGTPFDDFRLPGLVLATVVGGSTLAAAGLVASGSRRAADGALVAGAVTLGWIAFQVLLIGYVSRLQPLVALLGLALVWLAWRARARA
ncbi:MAG: hypothetical protein IPI52_16600 [Bacteroidetes bacterium]|nr:hypothetical protein [Bacteroidota bacterium]MBK9518085.1 hypothetical protein [Anaeromyxobacter sp.]MBL0276336.1 hypothetical protein [Anaeromyxobacter sp.]